MTATSRKLRNPGPVATEAQEDVCAILYAFAARIGAPIQDAKGYEIADRRSQLGRTLEEIANAYGFHVAEIQ